jgi:hypothetical protein
MRALFRERFRSFLLHKFVARTVLTLFSAQLTAAQSAQLPATTAVQLPPKPLFLIRSYQGAPQNSQNDLPLKEKCLLISLHRII